MKQMESRLIVAIGEFCLRESEKQSMLTKLVLTQINTFSASQTLRRRIERLPDSEQAQQLLEELDKSDSKAAANLSVLKQPFLDTLASEETNRERIEAALATLRSGFTSDPRQPETT